MKVNIYLKVTLHSLLPPFTESVTQSVKSEIFLCVGILDTFLWETSSDSQIPSVIKANIYLTLRLTYTAWFSFL